MIFHKVQEGTEARKQIDAASGRASLHSVLELLRKQGKQAVQRQARQTGKMQTTFFQKKKKILQLMVIKHTDFVSSGGSTAIMSPGVVVHRLLAHVAHAGLTHGRCPMHGSRSCGHP